MKKARKILAEMDMFSAAPTLRAKQQPQSSSLCSGLFSMFLFMFFTYVFIIHVVAIFKNEQIQSVQTESRLSGNQVKADDLFFGVRVGYLTAQESLKYFQVGYFQITEDGRNQSKTLSPCTKEQWSKLGDKTQKQFQEYKISEFYCPSSNETLNLKKVYYASNPTYIVIYIRPCIGYSWCESEANQKQYVKTLSDVEGAIFLLVYFLDMAIDPQQRNPVSYYINTDAQLAFTTKRGIIATIQLASFRIQTDTGVMPIQNIQIEQGNFVNSFRETSIQLNIFTDNYAFIYLGMNRKYILVQRTIGKLDQVLSYAGGLFSILISFLAIFMNSFNQYRYELMVAEGVFHQDEQGNRVKEDDFHFGKYLKYEVYDWTSTLFCYKLNWEDCEIVDKTREQANCQMDVTRLFRKIQVMQNMLQYLVDKDEKDLLSLVKPDSLLKIRRNRMILDYFDAIVQGKPVLTIQQYQISCNIMHFGMWLLKNDENSTFNQDNEERKNKKQMNYDKFDDANQALSCALNFFQEIYEEAQKIQLSQQLAEVQRQLSEQFFSLREQARAKIQTKIPIIILQRMRKYDTKQKIQIIRVRPNRKDSTLSKKSNR